MCVPWCTTHYSQLTTHYSLFTTPYTTLTSASNQSQMEDLSPSHSLCLPLFVFLPLGFFSVLCWGCFYCQWSLDNHLHDSSQHNKQLQLGRVLKGSLFKQVIRLRVHNIYPLSIFSTLTCIIFLISIFTNYGRVRNCRVPLLFLWTNSLDSEKCRK